MTSRVAVGLLVVAAVPATTAEARITVPPGVRVTTVATGMGRPSNLAFDSRGRLWTTSAGYVPARSDGVWFRPPGRRARQVVPGLSTPLGLTWYRGVLYVSHRARRAPGRGRVTAFSRFDGRRFRRRRVVVRSLTTGLHDVDSIVAGPDGRLYLGVGSRGDDYRGPSRFSAAVISVRPSGRGRRVEARGLRNPYGLAFIPGTRDLLVTDNGRDDLGPNRPPDELNVVRTVLRGSAWYGFPGCWGQGGRACRRAAAPLARLAPHAAAAGVAVARRFGRYGLSAFVAENGSTTGRRTGNDVVRVALRRRGRGYRAVVRPFARGFARHDPVGAAIGPRGALYVTLNASGKVLRFSARPAVQGRSTNG
jgi:glucose/arabinose dehydrogenase